MATVSKPTATKNYGPGLGLYIAGGLVAVALADTKAAPVVVAFLAAAAIYNANYLLNKPKPLTTPTKRTPGGSGGGGGAW